MGSARRCSFFCRCYRTNKLVKYIILYCSFPFVLGEEACGLDGPVREPDTHDQLIFRRAVAPNAASGEESTKLFGSEVNGQLPMPDDDHLSCSTPIPEKLSLTTSTKLLEAQEAPVGEYVERSGMCEIALAK